MQFNIKYYIVNFSQEFSYENSTDLQAIECSILEEINKLCLYDLKAKSEAYKLQRLGICLYFSVIYVYASLLKYISIIYITADFKIY